jgi:hypothetical protein
MNGELKSHVYHSRIIVLLEFVILFLALSIGSDEEYLFPDLSSFIKTQLKRY